MIPAAYFANEPGTITVELTVDTSRYLAAVEKARTVARVLAFCIETRNLTADQVDARFYVRGALDPAYASPAARDAYLEVMAQGGRHQHVAMAAFLRGWVSRSSTAIDEPVYLAWTRLLGDTVVTVGGAS